MAIVRKMIRTFLETGVDYRLVVVTTRTDDGRYECSVDADGSNPIVQDLGQEYIDRVKRAHIAHLERFPNSNYIRSRIGRTKNSRIN